jgi:hypothetical protein
MAVTTLRKSNVEQAPNHSALRVMQKKAAYCVEILLLSYG